MKPVNQVIDWPGIRAAAVAIGVREAARRAAANLPPDEANRFVERVLKRSGREKWVAVKSQPVQRGSAEAMPLSATVLNGSAVLENEINEHEKQTRVSLARYSAKAAKDAETSSLRDSPYVHKAAQVAGIAFKWEQKQGPAANVMVNVALIGVDPGNVQAQVLDAEQAQDSET